MIDYINIGSTPYDENCVQVTKEGGYLPAMRAECERFIALLRETFGEEPYGARLVIMSNPHDFGTYLEVVVEYDDSVQEAIDYAINIEQDMPARW